MNKNKDEKINKNLRSLQIAIPAEFIISAVFECATRWIDKVLNFSSQEPLFSITRFDMADLILILLIYEIIKD